MLLLDYEIWRPIAGYEGYYDISARGRVRSVTRYVRHNYGGIKVVQQRILALRMAKYRNVMICKEGGQEIVYPHKIVARTFVPNLKSKPFINHKDGNTHNNCVTNLEWVTTIENLTHAIEIGLYQTKGRKGHNPFGNSVAGTVSRVKELYASGLAQTEVARRLNMNQSTVSRIVNNKRWTLLNTINA